MMCNCRSCQARTDRDFWTIIGANYSAYELSQWYRDSARAREVVLAGMRGDIPAEVAQ